MTGTGKISLSELYRYLDIAMLYFTVLISPCPTPFTILSGQKKSIAVRRCFFKLLFFIYCLITFRVMEIVPELMRNK
jgi:hypothetical protein